MVVMALIVTTATLLFTLVWSYYSNSTITFNLQVGAEAATSMLSRELTETDPDGLYVNAQHNAVVFITARDKKGVWQTDTTKTDLLYGSPLWQQWICYQLIAQPGSSKLFELVRYEGTPVSPSSLPSTAIPTTVPTEAQFASAKSKLHYQLLASNVVNFDIEDQDGDDTQLSNPLLFRLVLGSTGVATPTATPSGTSSPTPYSCSTWSPTTLLNPGTCSNLTPSPMTPCITPPEPLFLAPCIGPCTTLPSGYTPSSPAPNWQLVIMRE